MTATRRQNLVAPAVTFGLWMTTFAWIMIRFA
jgi:hypothetical protein